MLNKTDIVRLESLEPHARSLIDNILTSTEFPVQHISVSCYSDEGVTELKIRACDALLAHRVEAKLKGSKIQTIANRIHVAQPKPRDSLVRLPHIPAGVTLLQKYDKNDPDRRKLARDEEAEEGGAGVFNINMRKEWLLKIDEWKSDIIPEIWEGKNIADFIDVDIEEKLDALEREEERLIEEGFYDSDGIHVSVILSGCFSVLNVLHRLTLKTKERHNKPSRTFQRSDHHNQSRNRNEIKLLCLAPRVYVQSLN